MSYIKGRKYLTKPKRISEFYKRLESKPSDSFNLEHRKFLIRLRVLSLIWYLKAMVLKGYKFKRSKDGKFLKYGKYK